MGVLGVEFEEEGGNIESDGKDIVSHVVEHDTI